MKAPVHDRRTCRSAGVAGTTVASRSKHPDQDQSRRVLRENKIDSKESKLSDLKHGVLDRNRKEKTNKDFESSTLGRRKKKPEDADMTYTWRGNEIEKYGTLGRRKKVREAGDGREETNGSLSKENKDTLDTYATLPRRKAREMTARWREQNLHPSDLHQSGGPHVSLHVPDPSSVRPLRRSRSIGKGESTRTICSFTNGNSSNFIRSTPRLSPRLTHTNSPAPSPRPGVSTQTPRKERTIICLETAIQTALLGHEVAAAMHALAHSRSQEDKSTSRPKVEIVRDYPMILKDPPSQSHVAVQVDVGWGVCSCGSRREASKTAEIEDLQRLLKEERFAKEEVQEELERTSQKIRDMLSSMEGVEKGK